MDFHSFAARELSILAERLAEAARREADAASAHTQASFEAAMERLRNDQAQVVLDNERLTAENTALNWAALEVVERTSTVFERIEASRTIPALLEAMAGGLTLDFGRVSVVMNGERIVHFGANEESLDPASTRVVSCPVVVRGETVATVLAGDPTGTDGAGPKLARLLQRHAGLALDRLIVELKTLAELRAYATMLLDEVEYVYEADVAATLPEASRGERLKENLRCARQIFQQRVSAEGSAAASLLEEIIDHRAVARADTAFGRELGIGTLAA